MLFWGHFWNIRYSFKGRHHFPKPHKTCRRTAKSYVVLLFLETKYDSQTFLKSINVLINAYRSGSSTHYFQKSQDLEILLPYILSYFQSNPYFGRIRVLCYCCFRLWLWWGLKGKNRTVILADSPKLRTHTCHVTFY